MSDQEEVIEQESLCVHFEWAVDLAAYVPTSTLEQLSVGLFLTNREFIDTDPVVIEFLLHDVYAARLIKVCPDCKKCYLEKIRNRLAKIDVRRVLLRDIKDRQAPNCYSRILRALKVLPDE